MATIVERTTGDGQRRLHVVFWVKTADGKAKKIWRAVPSGTRKDAAALRDQYASAVRANGGRWPLPRAICERFELPLPPEEEKQDPIVFEDFAIRWVAEYAKPTLRRRTYSGYETTTRVHAIPHFGRTPLRGITRSQVKALVAKMLADGKARGTIRNTLVPVAEMLAHAVEDGLIASNPAANIRIPAMVEERRIVPPSRTQIEAALEAARPDCKDAIVLACSLGLRRGELFGLKWSDIDREGNIVRIRRSNHSSVVEERTKTRAGDRSVPLFATARRLLAARELRVYPFNRPDDFVFCTSVGTPVDPNNFVRREWRPALKRASVPHFSWHSLRHFAISELIAVGADIKLLQAVAGHRSATVTLDRYGHLMTSRISEMAARFDPMAEAVSR